MADEEEDVVVEEGMRSLVELAEDDLEVMVVSLDVSEGIEIDDEDGTGAGVRNESTFIFRMTHTDGRGFPSLSVQCFL